MDIRELDGEGCPRIRILLVDDDAAVCRLLARCFERTGWSVSSALSASDAEARLSEWDCGIFDIDLGDGSGLVLAERLFAQGRLQCAVFYSGTLDGLHIAQARRLGRFILKPATFEELRRGVLQQLSACRHH